MIKYVGRLIQLQDNSIAKKAYLELYKLHNLGFNKGNWVSQVILLFKDVGLDFDMYVKDLSNMSIGTVITRIKPVLFHNYETYCMRRIKEMPVLRTYSLFKKTFSLEHYLTHISNFKLRVLLSKFRLSSHSLEIEKGRQLKKKIPADKRICKVCDLGSVEDEAHFVLHCCAYNEERSTLFRLCNIDSTSSSSDILNLLLNVQDNIFYICIYIRKCLKKREGMLTGS